MAAAVTTATSRSATSPAYSSSSWETRPPLRGGDEGRRLVHDPASGRVDQPRAGPGQRQHAGVDQVVGAVDQRGVHADEVRLAKELVQLHQADVELLRPLPGDRWVEG